MPLPVIAAVARGALSSGARTAATSEAKAVVRARATSAASGEGWSRFDQVKKASSLALRHRQAIKEGDFSPFIPALAFALAKDLFIDTLTATILVAVVTEFLGLFISVYLFIFLWGKGKWKVRLVIFILQFFDSIPAVSLIPFSTICVLYAFFQAKKEADKAKRELPKVEAQISQAQALEMRMQVAQQAQYQQEAANDLEYTGEERKAV